jgi:hypothetical protein
MAFLGHQEITCHPELLTKDEEPVFYIIIIIIIYLFI